MGNMVVLILMNTHKIEPVILLCTWLEEFDFSICKCSEKTLIPDIAHAIESELRVALLQQNRLDLNIV